MESKFKWREQKNQNKFKSSKYKLFFTQIEIQF